MSPCPGRNIIHGIPYRDQNWREEFFVFKIDENLADKTHSRKFGERLEQGCRVATSAKAGRYVAIKHVHGSVANRALTKALSLRSDRALTEARSLRSNRALPEARSLHSDHARTRLGRNVATELSPKLGCYVVTEHVHGSVTT
ncbi:hypothetical protein F2Q69_00047681 [Brassica cretica]|uniref:Uncharacterized protein n=1 Tax=Brassica cretica TaxID=69181 RepID=A0A8S9PN67_BRACR|nr:hypothetical protein F2Q69_00047681 [Brassica cretica]